jgi:hypothetical protein
MFCIHEIEMFLSEGLSGSNLERAGMPKLSMLWVVPVIAALAGCGVAAKVNARHDMEAAKVAYQACLAQHGQDVAACDALREAYEADLLAYQATSAAVRPEPVYAPSDPGRPPIPPNPMSVIIAPNGQVHPCMAMGPMMTVCN